MVELRPEPWNPIVTDGGLTYKRDGVQRVTTSLTTICIHLYLATYRWPVLDIKASMLDHPHRPRISSHPATRRFSRHTQKRQADWTTSHKPKPKLITKTPASYTSVGAGGSRLPTSGSVIGAGSAGRSSLVSSLITYPSHILTTAELCSSATNLRPK